MRFVLSVFPLCLLFATALTAPLVGQATMAGIVRDDSTGRPLPGVEVLLGGTAHRAVTGEDGRYLMSDLPAGRHQALFRRVGYLPARIEVLLISGETVRASQTLIPSVVVLDPIEVTESPERGLAGRGYEERKRMGFGKFYDPEELRKMEHLPLSMVLRRKGGVYISQELGGMGGGYPMNPYMRNVGGEYNCFMSVYLDGHRIHQGGIDVGGFSLHKFIGVHQLEAVEVYRSAAGTPIEFAGSSGQCGAIVLWTRRAP